MSNITVTTNQSVIAVTQQSGITVTTPEGQTIAVTVPNSTVNVTNTTDDITILTAGTLNITSSDYLATLTTSATTADQVLDTFALATYRTVKYLVSIASGSSYQSLEMLVNHNGTTANQTTYADLQTASNLATFTVDISGGNVRLLTTPVNAVTVYKLTRTTIVV
jgi:hypothetical protein